jgi:PAS domain S-box-containing protein
MSTRLRVLIVSDSKDFVLLVAREIRRGGNDLSYRQMGTATALCAALDRETWDVVISHYTMSNLAGLEALRLLQDSGQDIPFIFVCGKIGEELAVEAIKAGAHDCVMENNLARLAPAVEQVLQETRLRRARRPAEAAPQNSQVWYRTLVETSPDAVIVSDRTGKLLMANQRAADMCGCERVEALLGENVFGFLTSSDRQRAFADARKIIETGGARSLEYTMLKEDGAHVSIELSASVVEGDGCEPTVVVGVLRDITERVRAQEEIRYLKDFNEGILQTMAEGIVVQDAEGLLTYVNPAAATLLGYAPKELIGQPGTVITTPDQLHISQAAEERRLRGEADRYELDLVRKNGERVPVLVSGSPRFDRDTGRVVGTIAVFSGITDFKQAEEELRQRNRELGLLNRVSRALSVILDQDQLLLTILREVRRVFDVAATSLWLIDPVTGETVCQEATGVHRETVRGWRLAPGEGIAGWVVDHGESLIVPDTRIDSRHFSGVDDQIGLGVRTILSVPLRARQDVIGVIQVVDTNVDRFSPSDLTLMEPLAATAAIAIENARLFAKEEQRAAELAIALEQQRELDRFKDQLIQNVSHELRTPLGLIQAYAQLLANGELGELEPRQLEPVAVIARRTKMLSKIVEDLTAILETEIEKSRYQQVNVADLVNQLLVDFSVAVEKAGLTLEIQVEPDLPPVFGDPTHLSQVLDNLLGNALKFTPAGGSIRVSLAKRDKELVLDVSDDGVGIPDDQVERVFERFYQVDGSMSRRFGGAGLGLALVKEVVDAHSGKVYLESVVDQGSKFTVTLPIAQTQDVTTFQQRDWLSAGAA